MKTNSYKFIKNHAPFTFKYLVLITTLQFLISLSLIAFALISKEIVDSAISKSLNDLKFFSILILVLLALTIIFKIYLNFLEQKLKSKLEQYLEVELYHTILNEKKNEKHSGDYLTNLTLDIENIAEGISKMFPSIVSIVSRVLLSFVILFLMNKILAVLLFIFAIISIVLFKLIKPTSVKLNKKQIESTSKKREYFQETIENKIIINSFNKEENFYNKAVILSKTNFLDKIKKIKFSVFLNAVIIFIFQFLQYFILIFCAYQIYINKISFGDLTAILQLVSYIQSPLLNLNALANKYFNLITSLNRITPYLEIKKQEVSTLEDFEHIKLEDVFFSYSDKSILNDLTFEIGKNDFISIIGESGSGKTTLFKILLNILSPSSGKIFLNGKEQSNISALFSYVPQNNSLFSGTIKDNLTLYDDIDEKEIKEVLKICELENFIEYLEKNINYILKEKNQGISEGQAQRINIARAILQNRSIILLDESTSALDAITEEKILENLKKLNKTIIFISHKNKVFKYSDKIYHLENKKLESIKPI